MSADEFDAIANLFAPLATHPGARGLIDDVAVLEARGKLVLTTDAIVEGVHFLPSDPIDTVAKKALRVNLSDLAAKGAKAIGVLVSLIWPNKRPALDLTLFALGLKEDLEFYDVALLGGDTTSTPGPLTISITAIGEALGERVPSRADAKAGHHVWITGPVGDAFLGLQSLTQTPPVLGAKQEDQIDVHAVYVRSRYRVPHPPVRQADLIARYAAASIDISDGLIADAEKIATASDVAIRIDADAVPLSAPGHDYVEAGGAQALVRLLTGGDDYQALFTAPAEHRGAILKASAATGVQFIVIGDVTAGQGVTVLKADGNTLPIPRGGHRHRLGR